MKIKFVNGCQLHSTIYHSSLLAIQIFDRFRKYKMEFNTLCSRRRFVYLYLITCKEFAKQHVKFGDNNTRHKKVSTLILRNQGVDVRMAQICQKLEIQKVIPLKF